LKERDIRVLVDKVITEENVQITSDATDALVRLSKGDMRRALNVLQACHASSKSPFFPQLNGANRGKAHLSTSKAHPNP
jgi:DNA polymerase III delta prime subunit